MPSDITPRQHLVSLFDLQSCWMIDPLASELGYSVPSVRRFLNETGYYSSFTHNGKWYTLHSIPQFNRDGIWFFDDIGFSRVGSLTKTLIHLTTRSTAGMTAEQLGGKLRCRCHSILVQLCRRGKLQRLQQGRSHVYLAVDLPTQTIQRQALAEKSAPPYQLPAEVAVLILAEFIRQPNFSAEQLAKVISRRHHFALNATQIEELFEVHDLKKTIRTAASRH